MHIDRAPHEVDANRPLIYMWEIRDQSGMLVGR